MKRVLSRRPYSCSAPRAHSGGGRPAPWSTTATAGDCTLMNRGAEPQQVVSPPRPAPPPQGTPRGSGTHGWVPTNPPPPDVSFKRWTTRAGCGPESSGRLTSMEVKPMNYGEFGEATFPRQMRLGRWVFRFGLLCFLALALLNIVESGWPGWWTLAVPVVAALIILRVLGRPGQRLLQQEHQIERQLIAPPSTLPNRDTTDVSDPTIQYSPDGVSWFHRDQWRTKDCRHYWDGRWKALPADLAQWLSLKFRAMEHVVANAPCERPGCTAKATVVMASTVPSLPPFWAVCNAHRAEAEQPPRVTAVWPSGGT
jgi:hypothetical protein